MTFTKLCPVKTGGLARLSNMCTMSDNNSSNSSASAPKMWTEKLGMVAQLVGVWDESKTSIEAWLMNFEAKLNKTQLKDDENQVTWMINALCYGKAKSGYDLLKEFMGRWLKTDESVMTYCAAKADLYNQVLAIFK